MVSYLSGPAQPDLAAQTSPLPSGRYNRVMTETSPTKTNRQRSWIASAASPALSDLCSQLSQANSSLDLTSDWPGSQLQLCGERGVFAWFVPQDAGGAGWHDIDLVRGYLRLSKACLTTAFVITQRTAAVVRIVDSKNHSLKAQLLPGLIDGSDFATVAISHLSTSRRHLAQPVLRAVETPTGFRLEGYSPWVTGAAAARTLVTGAVADDGRQLIFAIPTKTAGVRIAPPCSLVALNASQTGPVEYIGVEAPRDWLLAGPAEQVMQSSRGAGTGGLTTSTLALGLADAAIEYLETESLRRRELTPATTALREQWDSTCQQLLQNAAGSQACSSDQLRAQANSLVLRATQSALAAAKGTGYVAGHPTGRWCREALFFLVWSCPQGVLAENLCEWAGIEGGI